MICFQGSPPQHPELLEQYCQRFTQLKPAAGGVCEEQSALSNKASSLDSSSASRLSSISSCFKRFSLSRPRISMSYTGRQFNNSFGEDFVYANKRRQGGKVETHVDLSGQPLVSGLGTSEVEGPGCARWWPL